MKVSGDWLTAPATREVFAALTARGHRALAVGGCVRNALIGVAVDDIDIATDATPQEVMDLAGSAGLKPVPTGIDHGTITIVSRGTGYEVTTFRADAETDGRHALVRFSTDIAEDATRRDFTMNALYAEADGTLVDPLDGLPDLLARHVRFIGDAGARIREDYLRILRFFRFSAWYGDPELGFDAEALAAISAALDGLEGLSRERIGSEMLKLLGAADPAPAVASMERVGVLARILPGTSSRALAPLVHLEEQCATLPDPIRRLAALGIGDGQRLRLSRKDQRRLALYQGLIGDDAPAGELGYRHGAEAARDVLLLRAAMLETPLEAEALAQAEEGAARTCPVRPADLMPEYEGAALGAKLREIETRWIASGFTLDRDALLN